MCSSRIVWFRLQLLLTSCKRKLCLKVFCSLQEYKKYISRADTLPNIIAITGLTPFKLKLRLTWDWGFRGLDRPWEKPSATFISFITAHDTNNFLKHFFYNSNTLKKLFLPSEIHAHIHFGFVYCEYCERTEKIQWWRFGSGKRFILWVGRFNNERS